MTATYLICTSQRSGSTWLTEMLEVTGRMGRPREILNALTIFGPSSTEWGLTRADGSVDLATYLARCRREWSTRNGVFGAKLFWYQLERLRSYPGWAAMFADAAVFLLLREDVVAQAVSLHIAAATDEWSSLRSDSNRRSEGSSRRESVCYDAEAITRHLRLIQYQNQAWIEFLSTNGIRHHVITYEMIQDDPVGVVRMIAARTGVELDRSRITAKVRYRRQATDIDVAFAARYRADSGMRLPGSAGEGSVVRVDGTLVVPMPIESHVAPVGTPLGQGAPMGTPVGDVGPRAARPR